MFVKSLKHEEEKSHFESKPTDNQIPSFYGPGDDKVVRFREGDTNVASD